jgi:hypothetical protein
LSGLWRQKTKAMNEPFVIEVNGVNQLIEVSCEAEARKIARNVNGKLKGEFDKADYLIISKINELQKN